MSEWLGHAVSNKRGVRFAAFNEALACARSLKLKTYAEWKVWRSSGARPINMPSAPDVTYQHEGWQGYGHWLGTGNVGVKKDQQFLPFKKALLYAQSLNLKSEKEWRAWRKSEVREANMPSNPHRTYRHEGWQGYRHWLGTR